MLVINRCRRPQQQNAIIGSITGSIDINDLDRTDLRLPVKQIIMICLFMLLQQSSSLTGTTQIKLYDPENVKSFLTASHFLLIVGHDGN